MKRFSAMLFERMIEVEKWGVYRVTGLAPSKRRVREELVNCP